MSETIAPAEAAVEGVPGLVLSGGGARGAYQVGVIKALADAHPGPSPFPVITGVSVGAINAVLLAEGADDFHAAATKMEELWRSLDSSDVFATDVPTMLGRFFGWGAAFAFGWAGAKAPKSFLDASPLEKLLKRNIDFSRIGRMVEEGHLDALAVTASSYATGDAVTFFQGNTPYGGWSRSRRRGEMSAIDHRHVLASAALPGVFAAQRLDGEWFGDGALRQTAPLSPAIHLGCDRLLMIAARDGKPDAEPVVDPGDPYPSVGVISGQLLDIVFNDNLDADLERLRRINGTLDKMMPDRRELTALRGIDTHMVRPSEDIRHIAGAHADEAPATVKMLLGMLGARRPPWVLPSYLTFEPGYINALIDLGEADARADMATLSRFLEKEAMAPQL